MKDLFRWISRRRFPYEPLIKVEISKSRLLNNLNEFRKIAPNHMVAPVLKSNAYGHGLVEVAQVLEKENRMRGPGQWARTPFLVVDSYFEAVALRSQGIRSHILIIGYTRPETIRGSRGQNTAFTVTSLESLRKLADIKYTPWDWETGGGNGKITSYLPRAKRAHRIHLKIDTGMHRQGMMPTEVDEAMEIIRGSRSIILEGICSHLSDADNSDESFTEAQIGIWNKLAKQFRHEFPTLKYVHLSNTDGHRFATDIDANVSRLGLGLYGLSQNTALTGKLRLQPVLEMKTIITSKKLIKTGDHVGYSNTFTAAKDTTVATIPVGYFEGMDRRLSGVGWVLVGKGMRLCPIIGRVSMNIISIDVSAIPTIAIGEEVIAISGNTSDANSIVSMAKLCNTIPYDIAVKIPGHLKRVVVN